MEQKSSELFDLCKQVYEKTGWKDTLQCIWNEQVSMPDKSVVDYGIESNYKGYSPLYTSDYLLEKLPKRVNEKTPGVYWNIIEQVWCGDYGNELHFASYADTPLKALLKLTLALSEAGEL